MQDLARLSLESPEYGSLLIFSISWSAGSLALSSDVNETSSQVCICARESQRGHARQAHSELHAGAQLASPSASPVSPIPVAPGFFAQFVSHSVGSNRGLLGLFMVSLSCFVQVELPGKLQLLWSFIKSHLRTKIIVFFSSCKQVRQRAHTPSFSADILTSRCQVRFVYELFRRMRPGVPLTAIHGKVRREVSGAFALQLTTLSN